MDGARPLVEAPVPQHGWISATRHALGMTLGQLAVRLNVTDRAAQMEQREDAGAITLKNLERATGRRTDSTSRRRVRIVS